MGVNAWSAERIELLCSLWSDGVSGGEIAKRLGVSRGAVAGERYKLGLPARTGAKAKAAMAANGRRTAANGSRAWKPPTEPAAVVEAAREATLRAASAAEEAIQPFRGSNPKPWELRGRHECAFPVAGCGSMVLSCCEPVQGRSAYCLGHRELAAGRPWPPVEDLGPAEVELAGAELHEGD